MVPWTSQYADVAPEAATAVVEATRATSPVTETFWPTMWSQPSAGAGAFRADAEPDPAWAGTAAPATSRPLTRRVRIALDLVPHLGRAEVLLSWRCRRIRAPWRGPLSGSSESNEDSAASSPGTRQGTDCD